MMSCLFLLLANILFSKINMYEFHVNKNLIVQTQMCIFYMNATDDPTGIRFP